MDTNARLETVSPMETAHVLRLRRVIMNGRNRRRRGSLRDYTARLNRRWSLAVALRLGLALVALAPGSHGWSAPDPVPEGSVRYVAKWPPVFTGPARAIVWTNDLLYLSVDDSSLQIFDPRNVDEPRLLGSIQFPPAPPSSSPAPLIISGRYAYLPGAGFRVIDVSNPTTPTLIGTWPGDAVRGFVLSSNYLYVSTTEHRLAIVDVSDPAAPVTVTNALASGGSRTLFISGQHLYMETSSGLEVYRLEDPRAPRLVGDWHDRIEYRVHGMAQWRNTLIVALEHSLIFVDLSDPEHLVTVGRYDAEDLLNSHDFHFACRGTYLYAGHGNELATLDLTRLPNPVVSVKQLFGVTEEILFLREYGVQGVAYSGEQLAVSRGVDGVEFFNLRDPANPVRSGHYHTYADVRAVAVSGNYAYLLNYPRGLEMVDLRMPSEPKLAGLHPFPMRQVANDTLTAEGSRAFATDSIHGLTIVDFLRPSAPQVTTVLSSYPEYAVNSLVLTRDYLLRTEKVLSQIGFSIPPGRQLFYWLYAYDLRDLVGRSPGSGLRLGTNALFGRPVQCWPFYDPLNQDFRPGPLYWFRDDQLYRLDQDLLAGSLAGTSAPPDLRLILPSVGCYDFAVSISNRVFLGGPGLTCLDFNHPGAPLPLGTLLTNQMSGMDGQGKTLAFVDKTGLSVLDISDPRQPRLEGSYRLDSLRYVATMGRYALVTRGRGGLIVLDMGAQAGGPPSILRQPQSTEAILGGVARFDVSARGTPPLFYQWQQATTSIPGATNATLVLSNVSVSSDRLHVSVGNAYGLTTSEPVELHVDLPPAVELSELNPGGVVTSGSNLTFTVQWSDPDSQKALVEVFSSSDGAQILLNGQRPSPGREQIVWPHVSPGLHTLWARVTDASGATATSATNTILSTLEPLFFFTNTLFSVLESAGPVRIGIGRTGSGAGTASVEIHTEPGTAHENGTPGGGHFFPIHATLEFGPGELTRFVELRLLNNTTYHGDVWLTLRLTNASPGWSTDLASTARVEMHDDDDPSQTNFWTDVVAPSPSTRALGSLRLDLEPPAALGKWRFIWETRWRDSGETASRLAPGAYPAVFMPRSAFLAPDPATYVLAPNAHESFSERYIPVATGSGSLSLTILPASLTQGAARGQWRLQGNANADWLDSGAVLTDLPAGTHIVECKPVDGFITPQPLLVEVLADQTVVRKTSYLLSPPKVGALPRPIASSDLFASALEEGLPHAFAGQLLTDAGYASGVVVKKRTVLTAAHAVFRGDSLTYASQAWWFFQRHRGEYEPVPLPARGSILFSGYAGARSNDVVSGLQPWESSATTLSLDIAALFFYADAGGGGYGGYVVSQPGHPWLLVAPNKLALSYPSDGVPEADVGVLHSVGPAPMTFEAALPNLYSTESLHHFPGSSGGPVCVPSLTSEGQPMYFPAGLQVGGSGRTIVRAIDLEVADMINRAEIQSNGGTDSTGGGFISSSFGANGPRRHSGLLTLRVGPPAALRLGGAWRVAPSQSGELGELGAYTNFTSAVASLAVVSTNFAIELQPLPGFTFPTNRQLRVVEDANVLLDLRYTVIPPRFVSDPSLGLGLVGTAGTSYRIEAKLRPEDPHWIALHRIRLEPGTNWLPGVTPEESTNRLHRAIWLSE